MCLASGCVDPNVAAALPLIIVFFAVIGFFSLLMLAFYVFLWWRIFSKAGYSGALGLLFFVPFGRIIMLCILGFSEWPIFKQQPGRCCIEPKEKSEVSGEDSRADSQHS